MADPHHVESLDALDRWTVGLYRAGLFVAAAGSGALAACHWRGTPDGWGRWVVLLAVALIVADLHLYDRKIRWVISAAGFAINQLAYAAALRWTGLRYDGLLLLVLLAVAVMSYLMSRSWAFQVTPDRR